MNKGKLHFVIGLPRSGKSTFCDAWVREVTTFRIGVMEVDHVHVASPMPYGVTKAFVGATGPVVFGGERVPRVVIAGDDFRLALHGHRYVPEAEGVVFAAMDLACRALLSRGFDVIVDETCTTEGTLLRYLRIDAVAVPHLIPSDPEVCKARALSTGRPYLVGPIERMHAQMADLLADWPRKMDALSDGLKRRSPHDVSV